MSIENSEAINLEQKYIALGTPSVQDYLNLASQSRVPRYAGFAVQNVARYIEPKIFALYTSISPNTPPNLSLAILEALFDNRVKTLFPSLDDADYALQYLFLIGAAKTYKLFSLPAPQDAMVPSLDGSELLSVTDQREGAFRDLAYRAGRIYEHLNQKTPTVPKPIREVGKKIEKLIENPRLFSNIYRVYIREGEIIPVAA